MSLATIPGALAAAGIEVETGKADDPGAFGDPRWAEVRDKPPEEWDLEAMYQAARGGVPVSATPLVAIIVPSYRETERIAQVCRISRNVMRQSMAEAGVESLVAPLSGDSLICRMRQRACHLFLMSHCTHMLFIDADIEVVTPDCVAAMLATGHDVIAGACPFKDATGRTVHNLLEDGKPTVGDDGAVEVADAGTGFMLISRKALLSMQKANPDLMHWCISANRDRGAPLWALFDTGIVDGVYLSEDYLFCRAWQSMGGKVYVYAPARFRHWGEHGFEASFLEQYGL